MAKHGSATLNRFESLRQKFEGADEDENGNADMGGEPATHSSEAP
jgi:hypothetical protein